eukprot:CAMPEP_0197861628 /NCGR_PEP_ID=MMETSP1438-20131217/37818_1 /TAXON_ID=1461541 /ORGANISM="Pterosperma sp., Strain CCMP1384" /LENGTH=51 /DNA_ID=CAMNT_0043478869 /DNA_START=211 /DNA_END=363 /DNA_ORIENTATION=+
MSESKRRDTGDLNRSFDFSKLGDADMSRSLDLRRLRVRTPVQSRFSMEGER